MHARKVGSTAGAAIGTRAGSTSPGITLAASLALAVVSTLAISTCELHVQLLTTWLISLPDNRCWHPDGI
jgi:hypothetical protein